MLIHFDILLAIIILGILLHNISILNDHFIFEGISKNDPKFELFFIDSLNDMCRVA